MFHALDNISLKKLFILAILLRLLVMPFYFHPDIKTTYFQTSFLSKGVVNIYTYISNNKTSLPVRDDFTYFPLTYFLLGGYEILVSPILGIDFQKWLFDASTYAPTAAHIFKYLFVLKLPYLVLDILTGFLLMQFFVNRQDQKKAAVFWLFNPIWLILIHIYSNFDIIPVFITTAALLLFIKGKNFLSAVLIGVAAGFKAYPLLFLPFMMLYTKNLKQSLVTLLSGLITFILIVLPFWSESFKNQALVSGLTSRIFLSSISIGFGEALPVSIILFSLLFFYCLNKKDKKREDVLPVLLAELLILFSFIHFHIAWLLWLAPLFTIILIMKTALQKILYLNLIIAFLIPLLYQDQSMTFGLLRAISPIYNQLPMPFVILQHFYDPYLVQSALQSALAGGSLILIWNLFQANPERTSSLREEKI